MADDIFKLPQSSYDTVTKVVQSYAHIGKKTGLDAVSKIMGTDTTTISRNIGFLVGVGLLEGGRDKAATPAGLRLARALEFNESDDIAKAWRDVLTEAPLIQRILSAIRVRGGMDASTLQTQIVYTAGVNKTSGTITGGGAIVEMLKAARLIVERDGRFIVPSISEATVEAADEEDEHTQQLGPTAPIVINSSVGTSGASNGTLVRVDIRLNITASANELDDVGRKIGQLISDLRETEAVVAEEQAVESSTP